MNSSSFASTTGAAQNVYKVNVHVAYDGNEHAYIGVSHEGEYVGSCVTSRCSDAIEICDYGVAFGTKEEMIRWCKRNKLQYSLE